jgi:hypothetical protein
MGILKGLKMEVKEVIPVVSTIIVPIEGVKFRRKIPSTYESKYENILCSINVTCNTQDGEGKKWSHTQAHCEEPYFIMGSSFWEEAFGKTQTKKIKSLCNKSIKEYLAKEGTV